jgi:Zn-dependent peptidase ImmA (M78 family)
MSDKKTATLPRKLIQRFNTRDPFEIAEALNITVLKRYDFKLQKGAFKVILDNSFLFINGNLSDEDQKQVCSHELGHALLHRALGTQKKPYLEYEIFDIQTTYEYDANVFAASLLIDENELRDLIYSGRDIVSVARELGINVNLLLIKLNEMDKEHHKFNLPQMPKSNFMGKLSDDAGQL